MLDMKWHTFPLLKGLRFMPFVSKCEGSALEQNKRWSILPPRNVAPFLVGTVGAFYVIQLDSSIACITVVARLFLTVVKISIWHDIVKVRSWAIGKHIDTSAYKNLATVA